MTIGRELFAILAGLVEEKAGLHYGEQDRDLFGDKVRARANDAGFDSLLDYYYFLRYDPAGAPEVAALVDALVVHETYFFREAEPLRVALDVALGPALAARRRPRVWCAASSTGEEPLTIAMMLAERALLDRVTLVASDVSARALASAREGSYGPRSFRALPEPMRARWFRERDGRRVIDASLRDAIEWRRVNLVDDAAVAALGAFDLVACRNVLIYFREETIAATVTRLSRTLVDGGVLLVGASESLLRFGTLLHCEEHGGAFLYVKRGP